MSDDLKYLQDRLAYLEESHRFTLEALELAVSLGDFQQHVSTLDTPSAILKETRDRLERIVSLQASAFFLVGEESAEFLLAFCEPDSFCQEINKEFDQLAEAGNIAWALNRNKPVFVPSPILPRELLLHPMATSSRIRGLFIGILNQDRKEIPDSTLALLSIVLLSSANALESIEHYKLMRKTNRMLQSKVEEFSVCQGQLEGEQSQLRATVEQLRVEIDRRTRMEEELRAAKQEAEAANRSKSMFLAAMSHEVRTPLGGVLGMLQLLELTSPTEEQQTYLRLAKVSSQTLLSLVGDILDLSAIEAGKISIVKNPFQPRLLMQAVEEAFSLQMTQVGLHFQAIVDPKTPQWVDADAGRIRQVLFNLLGNAMKFTQTGEVRVRLMPEPHPDDSQRVDLLFTVSDTGQGIPEEGQQAIFEPFVRGEEDAREGNFKGSGLGLCIARNLVRRMGGEMTLQSTPGKGSSFHFHIPATPAEVLAEALEEPPVDSRPEDKTLTSHNASGKDASPPLTVLVAEENEQTRITVATYLEKKGHLVQCARNGKEALEALRKDQFDVMLLDLCMAEADGVAVTEKVRKGECGPAATDMPIIAITACALKNDLDRCMQAGMNHYLLKPLCLEEIPALLQRFTSSKKS
jgi:two-component system, sensor histidine kinase